MGLNAVGCKFFQVRHGSWNEVAELALIKYNPPQLIPFRARNLIYYITSPTTIVNPAPVHPKVGFAKWEGLEERIRVIFPPACDDAIPVALDPLVFIATQALPTGFFRCSRRDRLVFRGARPEATVTPQADRIVAEVARRPRLEGAFPAAAAPRRQCVHARGARRAEPPGLLDFLRGFGKQLQRIALTVTSSCFLARGDAPRLWFILAESFAREPVVDVCRGSIGFAQGGSGLNGRYGQIGRYGLNGRYGQIGGYELNGSGYAVG